MVICRVLIAIVCWLLSQTAAFCQELYFKTGYGFYDMADMKELQKSIINGSQIPMKSTDEFPPYYTFSLQYNQHVSELVSFGGFAEFKSTGARAHYADYSGEAYVDQKLTCFTIGGSANFYFTRNEKFGIPIFFNAGAAFTSATIVSGVVLGGQASTDAVDLASTSIMLEPGFRYERYLSAFVLSLEAAYEYNIKSGLHLSSNSDATIVDSKGDPIGADWSGLRLRVGLGYVFKSQRQ